MIRCSVPFHSFRAGGHYCGRYGWEFFNKCGTSAFPLVITASQSISVSDNKQKITTSTSEVYKMYLHGLKLPCLLKHIGTPLILAYIRPFFYKNNSAVACCVDLR